MYIHFLDRHIELERSKLHYLTEKYGFNHAKVIAQSQYLDRVLNKHTKAIEFVKNELIKQE